MSSESTAPSKTDTNWFTDENELEAYFNDQRLADQAMRSSFDDAQSVIAEFASRDVDGAWPSLSRSDVAERLTTLIAPTADEDTGTGFRSLQQQRLNLCGPAALLVMAMGRDPVAVARYATELFDTGTGRLGNFSVTASEELRSADYEVMTSKGSISSQAEWMMMSAIRNATEPFWQPEWTGDPEQELAGMTRPEELADWTRQTGIWPNVHDDGRWASNPGIPNAASLILAEGHDIAMLIHANLITESKVLKTERKPKEHSWSIDQYFPNHWVLLMSEVLPRIDDNSLEFTIWTWGGRMRLRSPQRTFIDNYFGTVFASS